MIRLLALGVAAFVVFLVMTLPASVLTDRLQRFDVQADEPQGTVWNGSAAMLRYRGTPLGQVQWKAHPLGLLTARLQLDAGLQLSGEQHLQTSFSVSPGHRMRFSKLQGALPLSFLQQLGVVGAWTGAADLDFSELTLIDAWPTSGKGTLEVHNLEVPGAKRQALGSFRATFPADKDAGNDFTGALQSLDGPLDVVGTLKFSGNRSYVVEGNIAAKADAPPDMAQMIQYFGNPDAQGRRPFSVAGTL